MSPIGDAPVTDAAGGYQAAQTLQLPSNWFGENWRGADEAVSGFQQFVQRGVQTLQENPAINQAVTAGAGQSLYQQEALGQGLSQLGGGRGQAPNEGLLGPRPVITSEQANEQYGVPGYLRFNQPLAEEDAALQNEMARRKQWTDTVMARTDSNALGDFGASLAGAMTDPTTALLMASPVGESLELGVFGERTAAAAADATQGMGKVGRLWTGVPESLGRAAVGNLPYVAKDALLDYGTGHGDDFDMGQELANVAGFSVLHAGLHLGANAMGWFGRAPLAPTETAGGEGEVHVPGEPRPAAEPAPGAPADAIRPGPELPPAEAPTVEPGGPLLQGERPPPEPEPGRPIPPTPSGPARPIEVDQLSPDEQRGAHVLAVSRMANDEPVDVARLVNQALDQGGDVTRLDERGAQTSVESWRPIEPEAGLGDVAITTRGREVPIKFGLVEMSDLVTSHTGDMEVNGQYPPELQPRERDRAGAQAKNLALEKEMHPKLMIGETHAAAGAPIVSPDGVVESGNGRTIALRRSATTGATPLYERYVDELRAQGFPVDGMRQPVLVRMRTEPMSGAQRAGLAREMNADVTERMSAPEQAMADAQAMDPQTMAALAGEGIAARRKFALTFIQRVAPDQINEMVDQAGHLSAAGERRIAAALVAKAYGDKDLVEALYDTAEDTLKGVGKAMQQAAPGWAAMRASIERGETPACFDLTPALVDTVMLIKGARDAKEGVSKFLTLRLAEQDMFTGEGAVSQVQEAFLRLFYRNEDFTQARAADKVASVLQDYADWAMLPEHQGGDIFGNQADADQATAGLRTAYAKNELGWDERAGVQRPPGEPPEGAAGGTAGERGAAPGPVGGLLEPGGEGDQPDDGGLHEEGGGRADQGGGRARGDGGEPERERADDAAGGTAEPALPGEPGREPGAEAPAAIANDFSGARPKFAEHYADVSDVPTGDLADAFGLHAVEGEPLHFEEMTELQTARVRALPDPEKTALIAERLDQLSRAGVQVQQLADDFRLSRWTGKAWEPAGAGGDLDPELRRQAEELMAAEWNKRGDRTLTVEEFNRQAGEAWDRHSATPEPEAPAEAKINPATADRVIAADPELARLQLDLQAIEHLSGEPVLFDDPKEDPKVLAEAVRAVTACLREEV